METVRIWGFKSLLILCVCVFCVYEIQEVTLNNMDNNHQLAPRPALSLLQLHSLAEHEEHHQVVVGKSKEGPKTWITMGLCWSANAQVHGKENFPYKDAAPLSSQLWMKLTPAKVIMQIVYSEAEISEELKEYKKTLESYGATVFLVPTGDEMKCVLKSQMIRLLAYHLPFVKESDIIVTADVDAFVMTKDIYKPLLLDRKIWLYRSGFTLGSGSTFMMPFIGIKASVWKNILEYDVSMDRPDKGLLGNGLPAMIQNYGKKMNFNDDYTWDIDQHVLSYAILNSGLCSLPTANNLWSELNLKPNLFNDHDTCWHGSGIYEDCNNVLWSRNILIRYKAGQCFWWHFYPTETYAELRSKFQEIMAGQSENPLVSNILNAAKKIQRKTFGQELF